MLRLRPHRRALALAFVLLGALATWAVWSAFFPVQSSPVSAVALEPEDDVCLVAPPTPYDPSGAQPLNAARAIPAQARCPVCGMFPARTPEWAAQAILSHGDAHFFDSPLSLFLFLQDVARYSPGHSRADLIALYVSDSAQRNAPQWVDARTAFYVHGSNARGPMRAGNLPAFAQQEAAQAFAQRRGGRVLRFSEVDASLLTELAGRSGYAAPPQDHENHENHAVPQPQPRLQSQ